MTTDSPFFLSKVECPICKTINEYETVRAGAYAEEGRDTDFCPRDIKWRYPKYDGYNPLVFFVATCGNCYFSRELTPAYREWRSDENFRTGRLAAIKDRHLELLATADSVIKRLGEAIDVARFPNQSAILKLHLAALDEQLFEDHSRLDLGRLYLRIAWVFRSLGAAGDPGLARMRGFTYELETRRDSLSGAVQNARAKVSEFLKTVKDEFESNTRTAELRARILPYFERFGAEAGNLDQQLSGVEEHLGALGGLIQEFRTVGVGLNESGGEPAFAGHATFAEFLGEAQNIWDGIAATEQEALQKAVRYYREAFADGHGIAPGNQALQTAYLIADLSRRTGDTATAREFFNRTIRQGQEFISRNRQDKTQTALARKILELAIEQGRTKIEAAPAV